MDRVDFYKVFITCILTRGSPNFYGVSYLTSSWSFTYLSPTLSPPTFSFHGFSNLFIHRGSSISLSFFLPIFPSFYTSVSVLPPFLLVFGFLSLSPHNLPSSFLSISLPLSPFDLYHPPFVSLFLPIFPSPSSPLGTIFPLSPHL